ncbi:MAG: glycosyltransferase family 39 protein [Anaerolineales bacterium]|nr:glycosyltransferase family 39 protein [Anaerolineales bacterium]
MAGYKLTELPRPWFDEGWTLSTARNWAENNVYALRLVDQWISPEAMTQYFTVTMPVAFSMRIFGIGIVQARLPGILSTIGMFALLFLLTKEIYNSKVAWGTLFAILLLAPVPDLQPLIFGRQALGEMPMLFYLLAGYWFLGKALQKRGSRTRLAFILFTAILWSVGTVSKRQALPFWLLSWIFPALVALWRRNWRILKIILAAGILAVIIVILLIGLNSMLDNSWPSYGSSIVRPLYSMAMIWDKEIRTLSLTIAILYGFTTLSGLFYAAYLLTRKFVIAPEPGVTKWIELSIFTFASSWMGWFVMGSWSWPRYLGPVYVTGGMFFAKFIYDSTEQYDLRSMHKKLAADFRSGMFIRSALQAVAAIALVIWGLWAGSAGWKSALAQATDDPYQAADYINANTPKDALIETYDSELFFLLDRPYHYPPPEIQVQLNRRMFLYSDAPIDYKPMDADPDYIIVGPFSRDWGLYKQLVNGSKFKLVKKFGSYAIYEQVRK